MVKKKTSKKRAKKNKMGFFKGLWTYFLKYIFLGIKYFFIYIYKFFAWLFTSTKEKVEEQQIEKQKNAYKSVPFPTSPSKWSVVETIKGNYEKFWSKLRKADSLIGIILGARGSGKTAVALSLMENLTGGKKKFFAMGFANAELPGWIRIATKIEQIENNSYVVIDEGGILFSAREAMSSSNKMLSDLLLIARHKNLTVFFIAQNSSNLEVNTLRQADFLLLKKSSLLQKEFERKIIGKIYSEHSEGFEKHASIEGISLIYSDDFLGFATNELPSFWTQKVSKGYK